MLEIKDLVVNAGDKKILDGLNLKISDGKIHAIMGPNGTGKSTICKVLFNDFEYDIKNGQIIYNNEVISKLSPDEIGRKGLFLLNQNPIEIDGVTNAELLRNALNEKNGKPVNIFEFNKELESICDKLKLPKSFIHREINLGMSGGERKKNELLHMWILKPQFIILDEIDSGLDVDALKVCANSIKEYYELYKPSILIVTHRLDLLNYLKPEFIHIIKDGKITETGSFELAKKITKEGFSNTNELSENE